MHRPRCGIPTVANKKGRCAVLLTSAVQFEHICTCKDGLKHTWMNSYCHTQCHSPTATLKFSILPAVLQHRIYSTA
eukprot:3002649-Amphidinium_carterae.1